jgi:hypothetical protein
LITYGEPDMTKAVRIAAQLPASTAASEKSGGQEFVTIALFSGIGLLISLVAITTGVQGVWY